MAQMLSPNPARISQSLPIPKCSTCGQFVPLEDLGDHICVLPLSLPKPTTTPAAVHALLPKRLQGRIPSRGGGPSTSRSASGSPDTSLSINISTTTRLPQGDDLRAPTPSNVTQPRSAIDRETPTTARPSLARENPTTPRPTLHLQSPTSPAQSRGGSPLGYRGGPRGSLSSTQSNMLSKNMLPRSPSPTGTVGPGTGSSEIHTPRQSLVPPPERGIDTKTGGVAGMAGVGRRGFAAVARAAMSALPADRRLGPRPQRKSNQSKDLDLSRGMSF